MCMEDIAIGRRSTSAPFAVRDHRTEDFASLEPLRIPANPNRVGLLVFGRQLITGDNPELPQNRWEGWVSLIATRSLDFPNNLTTDPGSNVELAHLSLYHPTELLRIETHGQIVQWEMLLQPPNLDTLSPTDVWTWMSYTEIEYRSDKAPGK